MDDIEVELYFDPDTRPLLERLKLALFADIWENFDKSHSPDGTAWPPLAYQRPRNKGAGKPLLDTGVLRASITTKGESGHYEEFGPDWFEIGTNLEYAELQNEGGVIRPKQAKMLSLPISREAVNYPRPRNFPRKLFVLSQGKGKGSKAFLAEAAKSKRSKPTLHYLLLSEATIPAREFLGFSAAYEALLEEIVMDWYQEQFEA